MCLLQVYNETEKLFGVQWNIGWKVLKIHENGLPVFSRKLDGDRTFTLNQIHVPHNSEYLIDTRNKLKEYKAGFHIFLDREDAEKYKETDSHLLKICRVLYREISSIGINGDNHFMSLNTKSHGLCIIANQLVIKEDDWKIANV